MSTLPTNTVAPAFTPAQLQTLTGWAPLLPQGFTWGLCTDDVECAEEIIVVGDDQDTPIASVYVVNGARDFDVIWSNGEGYEAGTLEEALDLVLKEAHAVAEEKAARSRRPSQRA